MKRILVTGGAGNIGGALVRALIKAPGNAVSQRERLSWGIYGDRWARLLEELS